MPRAQPFLTVQKQLSRRILSSSSDDGSCSSTVSILSSTKTKDVSRGSRRSSRRHRLGRRRVQFDESCNEIHLPILQMETSDLESLWYSTKEIIAFRESHKFACFMIQRVDASKPQEEQYSSILEKLYSVCCDDTTTMESAAPLIHELESYFSNNAHAVGRIGMTSALVPAVARDKMMRRSRLLKLQSDLFLLPHWSHNSAIRELSLACEAVTWGPQLFSHVVARAQLNASSLQ